MENKIDKKIMIIDDDMGVLEAFKLLLEDNYSLIMVNNGYRAIDILSSETPPLIFLDIHMPGIDGMGVLTNLKDKRVNSKVVVVTGFTKDNLEEELYRLGADYIKKPFDIEEIEGIAKGILG